MLEIIKTKYVYETDRPFYKYTESLFNSLWKQIVLNNW